MWVLTKHPERRVYEFNIEECLPPIRPWATRQIQVHKKDGAVQDITLIDYLSIPAPCTSNPEAALQNCLLGHGHQLDAARQAGNSDPEARIKWVDSVKARGVRIDVSKVATIDWWCGKISDEGRRLRADSVDWYAPECPFSVDGQIPKQTSKGGR